MANLYKLFAGILVLVGSCSYGMLPRPDQDTMDMAEVTKGLDGINFDQEPCSRRFDAFKREIGLLGRGQRDHTVDRQYARQRLEHFVVELATFRESAIHSALAQRRCTELIRLANAALNPEVQHVEGVGVRSRRNLFPPN